MVRVIKMSEVVENGNRGIVIGLGDTRALAEAILGLIEDDDLYLQKTTGSLHQYVSVSLWESIRWF